MAVLYSILSLSCSRFGDPDAEGMFSNEGSSMYPTISGLITDESGKGIEHIKVSLEWNGLDISNIIYTSSEGEFKSQAYCCPTGSTTLVIMLEDVDGEEHGGHFASISETIILFDGEVPPSNYHIDYTRIMSRLSPATASENIP